MLQFHHMKEPSFPSTERDLKKERREQMIENTTLVIPENDGESVMIGKIANYFGIDTRIIEGSWDTPKEDIYRQLRKLSTFKQNIAIVELAAPEIEAEWSDQIDEGELIIIDHHNYKLDNGELLNRIEDEGSLMDQFLEKFSLDDPKLFEQFEYDWRFIHGISINDAEFIPGLIEAGYSLDEIKQIRAFDRMAQYGEDKEQIEIANAEAFQNHTKYGDSIYVIEFDDPVNYSYAKDLAIFEQMQNPTDSIKDQSITTVIIRPSTDKDHYSIAVEILGNELRMEEIISHLNDIQPDKRGKRSRHWWKANIDAGQLEVVKDYMKSISED